MRLFSGVKIHTIYCKLAVPSYPAHSEIGATSGFRHLDRRGSQMALGNEMTAVVIVLFVVMLNMMTVMVGMIMIVDVVVDDAGGGGGDDDDRDDGNCGGV